MENDAQRELQELADSLNPSLEITRDMLSAIAAAPPEQIGLLLAPIAIAIGRLETAMRGGSLREEGDDADPDVDTGKIFDPGGRH